MVSIASGVVNCNFKDDLQNNFHSLIDNPDFQKSMIEGLEKAVQIGATMQADQSAGQLNLFGQQGDQHDESQGYGSDNGQCPAQPAQRPEESGAAVHAHGGHHPAVDSHRGESGLEQLTILSGEQHRRAGARRHDDEHADTLG